MFCWGWVDIGAVGAERSSGFVCWLSWWQGHLEAWKEHWHFPVSSRQTGLVAKRQNSFLIEDSIRGGEKRGRGQYLRVAKSSLCVLLHKPPGFQASACDCRAGWPFALALCLAVWATPLAARGRECPNGELVGTVSLQRIHPRLRLDKLQLAQKSCPESTGSISEMGLGLGLLLFLFSWFLLLRDKK